MSKGRFLLLLSLSLLLNCLVAGIASAGFFGFGGDDRGKSGLDISGGYDVNTVGALSGRVISLPHRGDGGNLLLEVRSTTETVRVCLGPESFWEKKGMQLHLNDQVEAKGSRAQGRDGNSYLLTQKLVNRSTGAQLELRSERGEPVWQTRRFGGMGADSGFRGSLFQGGTMMRGGMMRGGMMRH